MVEEEHFDDQLQTGGETAARAIRSADGRKNGPILELSGISKCRIPYVPGEYRRVSDYRTFFSKMKMKIQTGFCWFVLISFGSSPGFLEFEIFLRRYVSYV